MSRAIPSPSRVPEAAASKRVAPSFSAVALAMAGVLMLASIAIIPFTRSEPPRGAAALKPGASYARGKAPPAPKIVTKPSPRPSALDGRAPQPIVRGRSTVPDPAKMDTPEEALRKTEARFGVKAARGPGRSAPVVRRAQTAPALSADLGDSARWSVPELLTNGTGQTYPQTILAKNIGSTTWLAAQYQLNVEVSSDGVNYWQAADPVVVATNVPTYGTYTFFVNLKPLGPGTWSLRFSMSAGPVANLSAPCETTLTEKRFWCYPYSKDPRVDTAIVTATIAMTSNGVDERNVDQLTGNLHLAFTDVDIPSVGPGLGVHRTYNSSETRSPSVTGSPFGQGWSWDYQIRLIHPWLSSNVTWIQMPDGSTSVFTRNPFDGTWIPALGARGTLVQNAWGWVLTDGAETQYIFNAYELLTAIVDKDGNATTLDYDGNRRVIKVTNARTGRSLAVSYGTGDATDMITQIDVQYPGLGAPQTASSWTYQYTRLTENLTTRPYLVGACRPAANGAVSVAACSRYEYNDRSGIDYSVDTALPGSLYRLSRVQEPENVKSNTSAFDVTYHQDNAADARRGAVATITGPKQTYGYKAVDGATFFAPVYRYDYALAQRASNGNLIDAGRWRYVTTVTDPYGGTRTSTLNGAGQLLKVEDRTTKDDTDPRTRSFTYAVTDYTGKVIEGQGPMSSMTNENGVLTLYHTDPQGNTDQVNTDIGAANDPVSTKWSYQFFVYDAKGNKIADSGLVDDVAKRNNTESNSSFAYDDANHRTQEVSAPNGDGNRTIRRWAYSTGLETAFGAWGACDPTTKANCVPKGLLLSETVPELLGPSATPTFATKTTYEYASNGDLMRVRSPAGVWTTFAYDGLGRRVRQIECDTDPCIGNERETTFQFDAMGNVVHEAHPKATNPQWAGAPAHQLVIDRVFDDDGRIIAETQSDAVGGDKPRTSRVWYDAAGRKIAEQDAWRNANNDTTHLTRARYDAMGRPWLESDPAHNVEQCFSSSGTYDPTLDRPNCMVTEHRYDAAGRETDTWIRNFVPDPLNAPGTYRDVHLIRKVYDRTGATTVELTDFFTGSDGKEAARVAVWSTYTKDGKLDSKIFANDTGDPLVPSAPRNVLLEQHAYDAQRNEIARNDANLARTTFAYDALGHQTKQVEDPGGVGRQTVSQAFHATGPAQRTATLSANRSLNSTSTSGGTAMSETTLDALGRMTQQRTTASDGNTITTYAITDVWGHVTGTVDPMGSGPSDASHMATTAYDQVGRAIGASSPPVTSETYSLGADTATSDAVIRSTGAITTATLYDTYGNAVATRDAAGNVTTTTYDEAGHVTTVASPLYMPVGSSLPVQAVTMSTYSLATGLLVQTKDARGNATDFDYDALGRKIRERAPARTAGGIRPTTRTWYDAMGRVVSIENPLLYADQPETAASETFVYDLRGRVRYHTIYTRAANGNPATTVTEYTNYDDMGRVIETIAPATSPSVTPYPANHVDPSLPAPASTKTEYNALGETVKETVTDLTTNASRVTTQTFNLTSQPLVETDAAGLRTRHVYDGFGREVSTEQWTAGATPTLVSKSLATLRPDGKPVAVATPNAVQAAGVSVDAANLSATVTGSPRAKTYCYDNLGRVVRDFTPTGDATAAATQVRSYAYDSTGNLSRYQTATPTTASLCDPVFDAKPTDVHYVYNAWGLLDATVEPSPGATATALGTRTFKQTYAVDGKVATSIEPGAVTTTYNVDLLGNVVGDASAGTGFTAIKHTYGYDAFSRRTSAGVAGTANQVAVTFDDASRPVKVVGSTRANDTTTFRYDAAGQLVAKTGKVGPSTTAQGTTNYTYNGFGQVTTQTDPLSASTTNTVYTYAYDNAGRPSTTTVSANGTAVSRQTKVYGADGRVAVDTLGDLSGNSLFTRQVMSYQYDANGNIASQTSDTYGQAKTTATYAFDDANRLRRETTSTCTYANGSCTLPAATSTWYRYDATGNRAGQGQTSAATDRTWSYDNRNRLVSDTSGKTYTFNDRGDLTKLATKVGTATTTETYTYDAAGRMTKYANSANSAVATTVTYDDLDRVVKSATPTAAADFFYEGLDVNPLQVGTEMRTKSAQGGFQADRSADGATPQVVRQNQHGDIASMCPIGQACAKPAIADAWGKTSQAAPSAFGYQGAYTDKNTGLVFMSARWYAPDSGRFMRRDTVAGSVGNLDGLNRYIYALNDPIDRVDLDGHKSRRHHGRTRANGVTGPVGPAGPMGLESPRIGTGPMGPMGPERIGRGTHIRGTGAGRTTGSRVHSAPAYSPPWATGVRPQLVRSLNQLCQTYRTSHGGRVNDFCAAIYTGMIHLPTAFPDYALDRSLAEDKALWNGITAGITKWWDRCALKADALTDSYCWKTTGKGAALVGSAALCEAATEGVGTPLCIALTTMGAEWAFGERDPKKLLIEGAIAFAGSALLPAFLGLFRGTTAAADGVTGAMDDLALAGSEEASTAERSVLRRVAAECNSFTPETKVEMADGSAKSIKDVQVGDSVKAGDANAKTTSSETVVGRREHDETQLVDITVDGSDLHATANHPFWVENRHAWVNAGELTAGDVLRTDAGALATIERVDSHEVATQTVYNLTVDRAHTFFVLVGTKFVLVHNAQLCGKGLQRSVEHGEGEFYRTSQGELRMSGGHFFDGGPDKTVPGLGTVGLSADARAEAASEIAKGVRFKRLEWVWKDARGEVLQTKIKSTFLGSKEEYAEYVREATDAAVKNANPGKAGDPSRGIFVDVGGQQWLVRGLTRQDGRWNAAGFAIPFLK